ncbi:MAG: CHAT domain-containing protein [Smithellaceae bacterium]|nr:CHAT domain-containing protein [Smithellaceae bacterium]
MENKFSRKLLLGVSLFVVLALGGCAAMMDHLPSPPASMSRIELTGPYDQAIPEKLVGHLRGASMTMDWAIPYIFMTVGLHFESMGDGVKAIHFFDRSIEEFRKRNDLTGEGTVTNRKIFALYEFGSPQAAYDVIRDREKAWTVSPMRAFVDYNYGHYFLLNGDYARAMIYFKQAFAANRDFRADFNLHMLRRDTELEYGITVILADFVPRMSKMYTMLDFDKAMIEAIGKGIAEGGNHLNQVLTLNREIRQTKIGRFTPELVFEIMEANVYNFLGLADGIRGNGEGARRHLTLSRELARKSGYRVGEIDSLFFLNLVNILEQNITEGRKAAEQMNEMADKYRFPFYQVWAKYILSRYHIGFGDNVRAAGMLREAIAVIEGQRGSLAIDVLKETYLSNRQVVYDSLIELLAREGDYQGALTIAEQAKSRILVDLLAGKDLSRNPAEEALLKEEEEVGGEIISIKKQLARPGGQESGEKLLDRLQKDEVAYRGVILRLKKENEELSSLLSVQAPDPATIQALLDEKTTLLDYYVTDNLLYVWALTKDRVHLERIKITREDLRGLVQSFREAITSKDDKTTGILSQRIYDVLLKPVIPFVAGDRIGFVPHDFLHYLPFAALGNRGRYLADGFSIFYLPGAGVLKYVMDKKMTPRLKILALGNPDLGDVSLDLPSAALEVEMIRKRIGGTTVLLGKEATKTRLRKELGNYDVVHFATHGQFVPASPLKSSLLLTPGGGPDDGRLTALEIFKLRFPGRAVIMSACSSALGLSDTGNEIVGLTRSFLYAGSNSVVSTLWNVADKETSFFMDDFYRELGQGKDMAGSLRSAQLDLIRKGYSPFYWAPFILTGRP